MYTEVFVPRKNAPILKVLKIASAVLTLVCLALTPVNLIALAGVVVFALLFWQLSLRVDIEYQYIYLDGDLQIDKVIGNARRKHIATVKVGEILLIAPQNAPVLHNHRDCPTVDVCANDKAKPPVVMVCRTNDTNKKFLLQMNDALLEILKRQIPSKLQNI